MAQAPRASLDSLLASGELVEVLPHWKAPALPVSVVFPHGRHLAPRVRIFVDWIAQLLGEAGAPGSVSPAKPARHAAGKKTLTGRRKSVR
jgi:DNA-binding transcriptional LysR family regulator